MSRWSHGVYGLVAAAIGWLAAPAVAGAVITGDGSFDWLVRDADAIVVLRVDAIDEEPAFEHYEFEAVRLATLASEREVPEHLRLRIGFPVWPDELGVPFAVGATVLAVLEESGDGFEVVNDTSAILPAGDEREWEAAGDRRSRVFGALRSALRETADDRQAALLLVLLSEIASASDAPTFATYLGDAGPWARRGALAGLLRIAPTPELVEAADADIGSHLAQPPPESDQWLFVDLYDQVLDDPYDGPEEAPDQARPFLPIYRTIADAPDPLGFDEVAVHGLKLAGDRSDALRLWAYATRQPPESPYRKGHADYLRHEALDGLCRIFGIPLERPQVTGYSGELSAAVEAQERRLRDAVHAALVDEGVLAPEAPR